MAIDGKEVIDAGEDDRSRFGFEERVEGGIDFVKEPFEVGFSLFHRSFVAASVENGLLAAAGISAGAMRLELLFVDVGEEGFVHAGRQFIDREFLNGEPGCFEEFDFAFAESEDIEAAVDGEERKEGYEVEVVVDGRAKGDGEGECVDALEARGEEDGKSVVLVLPEIFVFDEFAGGDEELFDILFVGAGFEEGGFGFAHEVFKVNGSLEGFSPRFFGGEEEGNAGSFGGEEGVEVAA